MLNPDRKDYVTASQSHRVMSGFETELAGKSAVKPEYEDVDKVLSVIKETGKPKVGELKALGITASGAEIEAAYKYHRSQIKVFSDGMWSVAREIAMSKFIDHRDEHIKTQDMERGNIQEGEAVAYLEGLTGVKFSNTEDQQSFMTRNSLGVTPDGLQMDGFNVVSCAEVKNPKDTTHMKYLHLIHNQDDLLEVVPEYYWQCQTGLYVTECEKYHWLSYHKEFTKMGDYRGVYVCVEPVQEDIDMLVERSERVLAAVPGIVESILSGGE